MRCRPFRSAVFAFTLLFTISHHLFAQVQGNVFITGSLLPPYTGRVEDIPNRLNLTLRSQGYSSEFLQLQFEIKGNNGVTIKSNYSGNNMGSTMYIPYNGIIQVPKPTLGSYFDPQDFSYAGTTAEVVFDKGLPDGNYTLCVNAWDMVARQDVTAPGGKLCINFTVQGKEPPMIIQPACGNKLTPQPSQNIIFTWTPAIGAPAWTKYRLRIVEVLNTKSAPEDALRNKASPAVFDKEISSTTYMYGPADPLLTKGKTYAWEVIATDMETMTSFRNEGRSKSCSFQYGDDQKPFIPLTEIKPKDIKAPAGLPSIVLLNPNLDTYFPGLTFSNATVKGKAYYDFYDNAGIAFTNPFSGIETAVFPSSAKPLPNMPVTLKVVYFLYDGKQMVPIWDAINSYPEKTKNLKNHQTVASAVTDGSGNYSFNFFLADSMGLVVKNADFYTGSGEFKNFMKGDLYRFFQVMVQDDHYLSDDRTILVQPGEIKEANFLSYLRTYKLNVNVATHPSQVTTYTNGPLHGMEVMLLRKSRPINIPKEEGMPETEAETQQIYFSWELYDIIATAFSNSSGDATFSHLIKNIGPNDVYYLYARSREGIEHNYYVPLQTFAFDLSDPAQSLHIECDNNLDYNSQFGHCYKQYSLKVNAFANKPAVYGKVLQDNKEQTPVADTKVRLLNYALFFASEETSTYTDSKGDYSFSNLKSPTKAEGSSITGPIRIAEVNVPGFDKVSQLLNNGVAIPDGLRLRQDIKIKPDATIAGQVTDENGNGLTCYVKVVGGSSTKAVPLDPGFINQLFGGKEEPKPSAPKPGTSIQTQPIGKADKNLSKGGKAPQYEPVVGVPKDVALAPQLIIQPNALAAYFEMAVPSGKRTIIFEPESSDYFSDTLEVDLKKGKNDLGTIVIKKKEHKLQVQVFDGGFPGQKTVLANNYISKAKVSIVNITEEKETDARGNAYFNFGGGNSFTIRLKSPEGADYEDVEITANNIPISKSYQYIKVIMYKSAFVEGLVVDENGKPLKDAVVKVKADGPSPLEAITNDKGEFKIRKVPPGNGIEVSASKAEMIGQVRSLDIPNSGLSGVKFTVRSYPEMDFSELLGFPVLVDSLVPVPGGAKISGRITKLPGNTVFAADEADPGMAFKDVVIKPGSVKNESGVPKAVPEKIPMSTEVNSLKLKINNTFFGIQSDNSSGLQIVDLGAGVGAVKGRIAINTSESFQDVNIQFTSDSVYITDAAANAGPVNSITANGKAPFDGPINLSDPKGKDIQFTIYDFAADAAKTGSRLEGNKLILPTVLHTNIKSLAAPDLKMDVGEIRVTKTNIENKSGTSTVSATLEQWKLTSSEWSLSVDGLKLNTGKLETHMADIPFSGIEIKPVSLESGVFNTTELDMKGIAKLKVTGQSVLVYENDHWKLSITPKTGSIAAYIENLPGLGTQTLSVKSSYLTSDKKGTFNLDLKPLKVYDLFDFYPNDLYFDEQLLKSSGTIDLHAPNVPVKNTALVWEKSPSGLKLGLQNFSFEFFTNGVDLKFVSDNKSLRPDGFFCPGTLSEPGLYSMNVEFRHTASSTKIEAVEGAEMKIDAAGLKKFINIDGVMTAGAGEWSNFVFSGDMTGTAGAEGRLTFEIKGDIVASGESIDVQNIETPFGNLNITFDFAKKRLTGHLECDKEIKGTGQLKGTAEMIVDADGWYLCAGGKLTMKNNPYIKEANMAILFGNYPVGKEPFVQEIFATYSYTKALPSNFKNQIKGFFLDGSCTIPVPYVPDIDIDLVVVSGELWVHAGGDFSLGMEFSNGDVTFFTGLLAYIEAHIGLSGSIGIACAGCSGNAKLTLTTAGQISSSGAWFTKGGATLDLSASAYAGGGCCDSDCDYLGIPCPSPCFSDSWSGTKSFGAEFYVGSDDNYFNVNF